MLVHWPDLALAANLVSSATLLILPFAKQTSHFHVATSLAFQLTSTVERGAPAAQRAGPVPGLRGEISLLL